MKKLQTMMSVVLGAVLIGIAINASAQTPRPCYATVVRVQGDVTYSLGDNVWHPLVAGKYLPPGSVICTTNNGVADVVLGKSVDMPQAKWAPERISLAVDAPVRGLVSYKPSAEQNVVRLMPNTVLAIDRLTTTDTGADTVGDTELNLKSGKIFASVKKLSPVAQYLVKTPTGIAGVRGTQFSIELNPDGSIKSVQVYKTFGDDGLILSVTISGIAQTWTVGPGQMVDFGSNTVISIPPQVMSALREFFTALRTTYLSVVSFDYDHTRVFESSDLGHKVGSSPTPAPTPEAY